jgi:hypothetical protein
MGIINVGLQLALLAIALKALTDGRDVVSPAVPDILLPLGVLLLLLGGISALVLHVLQNRTEGRFRWRGPANRVP